jgi:hypothetical protein
MINSNAITLSPAEQRQQQRIDWDRELTVQSSTAQARKEKNYRDLSSLTPEQLDWVKKNHMEPVTGFQWDRNSRGELLRHGIIKLNDYCVLIVVIPFCRFGGKIQASGALLIIGSSDRGLTPDSCRSSLAASGREYSPVALDVPWSPVGGIEPLPVLPSFTGSSRPTAVIGDRRLSGTQNAASGDA